MLAGSFALSGALVVLRAQPVPASLPGPRPQALALRDFAPGLEAPERFAAGEPQRVHQCVFGVLALESEPVDPGCDR